ncbi:cobalt ECF transporter T component CbiQ [Actinomycetospora cinnamomea]|uniref:Cobalt/nickel transport system permease protein n=1 Tax=Actinomycetospora cinnamomea TaxID=663609 RepID=A0A2U1EAK6_9PSEU|nr:cobalt ECF transporter T component CbiQ [Actinomycetospora cinnamomea]PVY96912.1 cobalt/nickel transport system permease protein [Actinomycetospora cinnamomea]
MTRRDAPLETLAHTGPWRERHPADKAVLALGLLVCAVALPPWPGAAVVGTVALVLLAGPAGVGPGRAVRLLRAPAAFIVVGALPLLVAVGGPTVLRWDPAGLARAGELVGRSLAATLCLLLFAATTPLADVLPRLSRLGVPPAVTEVAALIYRLLFLLLDTARTVREAQAGRLGFATRGAALRSAAGQAGAVFVRAFDRARRLDEGLALRGYGGDLAVDVDAPAPSRRFIASSVLLLAVVVTTTLLLRLVIA